MRCTVSALDAPLHADIQLPVPKSISSRTLILHALARSKQTLHNLSDCDDTRVIVRALQNSPEHTDIMAAGTAMRFFIAYLSVTPDARTITGTQRMQRHPTRILVDALRQLDADIKYTASEGFLLLHITGSELRGNEIFLVGNVSSQYIPALLMIGAILPRGLHLYLTGNIASRPYISPTLQLIYDFGGDARWNSENTVIVHLGGYQDVPFTAKGDRSAASYWYQILALRGNERQKMKNEESLRSCKGETIELFELSPHSYQGDSHDVEVSSRPGVHTGYTEGGVRLTLTGTLVTRLEEDMIDIPDPVQTFVATRCLMDIPFHSTGLQSLKIKEIDRITAPIAELHKLGYAVCSEQDNILLWNGERCPAESTPLTTTYEDHRMAMAFAPACITLPQLMTNEPQVISEFYSGYWEDLKEAGFIVCH